MMIVAVWKSRTTCHFLILVFYFIDANSFTMLPVPNFHVFFITRSIFKMLGPFATRSRLTPIHQVSPLYCRTPPSHRCPQRRQRQRVTEGTAMAPWNGPNYMYSFWAVGPVTVFCCCPIPA